MERERERGEAAREERDRVGEFEKTEEREREDIGRGKRETGKE